MMSTDYIDVTKIGIEEPGTYISRIGASKNPVLVFMPNLNYAGMLEAEDLAGNCGIGVLNIPITLPIMDLIRQMEYAGVSVTPYMISSMESSLRSLIVNELRKERDRIEREKSDSG